MLEPLMFEWFLAGGVAAGGQLTTTTEVENYPGFADGIDGTELMMQMRQQSLNSGCTIETKTVEKVDLSEHLYKVWAQGEEEPRLTKTIIIATGAIAKRLWLPGEETYRQRGISACAVCDGALPIFRDKHLVVIWGGDSACEEASYLTKYASKLTMLVRRDELRASKVMQQRVFDNPKIEILRNTEGKEILGDGDVMTWLRIHNNQTDEVGILEAGGLFYAIGHTPNTNFLWGQVLLDEAWYIMVKAGTTQTFKPSPQTPLSPSDSSPQGEHASWTLDILPGVFAAGDVQDKKYRQAVTSAGTGCMAALEAEHWLGVQG